MEIISPLENLGGKNINDLPDEVLEYILSLISPYYDSDSCKLVSKRWWRTVNSKTICFKKIFIFMFFNEFLLNFFLFYLFRCKTSCQMRLIQICIKF